MAKVSITKKLVEENSQLADLLAEKNIKVGDKIESSELDELKVLAETTELVELTQEHFDQEPGLTEKGFKVGDKIRVAKKSEKGKKGEISNMDENNPNSGNSGSENPKYLVKQVFKDKNDHLIIYNVGDVVPAEFDKARIKDLLKRDLIQEA